MWFIRYITNNGFNWIFNTNQPKVIKTLVSDLANSIKNLVGENRNNIKLKGISFLGFGGFWFCWVVSVDFELQYL